MIFLNMIQLETDAFEKSESSLYYRIHSSQMININEAKKQVIIDNVNYCWAVEINLYTRNILSIVSSDSPITKEEIINQIENRSGYQFHHFNHKQIGCDMGIGSIPFKKVRLLRIISLGTIETPQIHLEHCKNLFLLSCMMGLNCFGLN